MPKIKVNNVEIHYEENGKGNEVLIFSHGYLFNNTMFKGQIEAFKDDFRCISFDHRGHGKSEVTADGYELDNLVTDAICLIEELKLGPVHFVGMSTGGFVAQRVAIRRPELLKSMVLMDTSAEGETEKALKKNNLLLGLIKNVGWLPAIGSVMSILFHESFLKDKSRQLDVKEWRKIITSQDKKGIVPFGKGIFARGSILEKLSDISIPTAVIFGQDDIATSPAHNKRIANTIPNADCFIIPAAGHSAAIEKPKEVADAMRKFYTKIGVI